METSSKCLESFNNANSTITIQQQYSGNILQSKNALSLNENDLIQCPTCASQLRPCEMAQHCEQEMEHLRQMKQSVISSQLQEQQQDRDTAVEENSERKKPWTVFQRVQRNRQLRMKSRTRKRPPVIEHACPVCNKKFSETEIQNHVESCLRRSNNNNTNDNRSSDEHSSNDDDDDGVDADEYEEYEWAGQKRIRVSSLLRGGYASLGIGQTTSNGVSGRNNDEEEDLNVDEDDTQIYGPAQYGESDVIMPTTSIDDNCSNVTSYMRHLIADSSSHHLSNNKRPTIENFHSEMGSSLNTNSDVAPTITTHVNSNVIDEKLTINNDTTTSGHYEQVIDSLKTKLRNYENHVPGKYKCLICLDDYHNPAISVACWHVHCEQCWLRSLGARKLCPQCNLITTPRDLRRIYM